MKLTRKQIAEGLKATPIQDILLGVNNPAGVTLTAKQKAFAEDVAKGKPKAQAYRENYNTKGNKAVEAVEGHKLANNPKVSNMIEAFKASIEAQKYLFPAHLRAMAIQKLTEKALDDTLPPSQQLKALELIGKMSEVALFTERKEVITTNTSADAKNKLLGTLLNAITNSKSLSTDKKAEAQSLLDELTNTREVQTIEQDEEDAKTGSNVPASGDEIGDIETPPDADPQNHAYSEPEHLHSISDKQSPTDKQSPAKNTGVPLNDFTDGDENDSQENDPLDVLE